MGGRSQRIRKIVVDSGSAHADAWRFHERSIIADYRRAYGEEPGALIGVALMTDTDNTRSRTHAGTGRFNSSPRTGESTERLPIGSATYRKS